tara:strand:+ start:770 stop:1045 length:276 start_codon:yes stop_codon:yes gene_type:complete
MRALTEPHLTVDIEWRDYGPFLDIRKNGVLITRKVEFNTYNHGAWFAKKGCDATDVATGHRVKSKGWKSHNGSVKHAAEDLTRFLIARGII